MLSIEKTATYGDMRERIVCGWLSEEGYIIQPSIDPYDKIKDISAKSRNSGRIYTFEVKTQVPYVIRNAVTFPYKQWEKCTSVSYLCFVVIEANVPCEGVNTVYIIDTNSFLDKSLEYTKEYVGKEYRVVIPIKQDAVMPVKKLSIEDIARFNKYKTSTY